MVATRARLRRWHIWLGWIVGVPVFLWVLTGLVMVIRPIEEVRGTHLLDEAQPVRLTSPPVIPRVDGLPLSSLKLEQREAGPRWVAELPDGTARLADPATGAWLPGVSAVGAAREVHARYAGAASIARVTLTDADDPPLDLRRPIPAWQVRMSDGTNIYVDSRTGGIVATRTPFWRVFDLMWGLHIMDLKTREDTHNPLVIGFAIIALVTTVLALAMLPLTIRRRRRSRLS